MTPRESNPAMVILYVVATLLIELAVAGLVWVAWFA